MTRRVGTMATCSPTCPVSTAVAKSSTASAPMRTGSCSTTERGGLSAAADRKSSKPMRATSSGQRRPRSWMAIRAASAIRLLKAKMARGRGTRSRISWAALWPWVVRP